MGDSMSLDIVKIQTSKGDIVITLDRKKAPVTVANFLKYVEDKFFDGTIFHRVIPDFMVQGGGMNSDMSQKDTRPPIVNEASNGLKNNRTTLAMARTNDPDSATAQFFINLKNNDSLNHAGSANPGYAVFGKVTEGMDIVDEIAAVPTAQKGQHDDVPVETVSIESATVVTGQ